MESGKSSLNRMFICSGVASAGLSIILVSIVSQTMSFWRIRADQQIESVWPGVLIGLLVFAGAWLAREKLGPKLVLDPRGFVFGLVFLFMIDWLTRGYSFLPGPEIRGEILLIFILAFSFFEFLKNEINLEVLAVVSCLLFFVGFLIFADGGLLFSDDHSVFLYRLLLLKEHFPNIPVYNPLWSAGRDTLHFFATGNLNIFLIFFPLINFLDPLVAYTLQVAILLFLLTPGSMWLAARILGFSRTCAAIAALLSLSGSALWYQWALKYGTLGCITSIALLPVSVAYILKAFQDNRDLSARQGLIFFLCTALVLLWSPSGLVLLPLLGAGLLSFKRQVKKTYLVISSAMILLVTIPWLYFFWTEWNVSKFLNKTDAVSASLEVGEAERAGSRVQVGKRSLRANRPAGFSLEETKRLFSDSLIRINPLLLIFTIPGLALLRPYVRKVYAILLGWLVVLSGLLPPAIPQIELDRMFLVLAHLACLPVALAIESLISRSDLRGQRLFSSVAISFLGAGLVASAAIVGNRMEDRFSFAGKELGDVVMFVKDEIPGEGRLFFSGFVLEDLDNAHIAPLPAMTGRPMIAVSPFHDHWSYSQPFPQEVIAGGEKAISEYLDLIAVDAVAAHEPRWKTFFSERPDSFLPLGKAGKFNFFSRVKPEGYFLEGKGEIIEQTTSIVRLSLAEGEEEAVLKFRYLPHLDSECELSPVDAGHGLQFIKLSECDAGQEVIIKSKGFFSRLLTSIAGSF